MDRASESVGEHPSNETTPLGLRYIAGGQFDFVRARACCCCCRRRPRGVLLVRIPRRAIRPSRPFQRLKRPACQAHHEQQRGARRGQLSIHHECFSQRDAKRRVTLISSLIHWPGRRLLLLFPAARITQSTTRGLNVRPASSSFEHTPPSWQALVQAAVPTSSFCQLILSLSKESYSLVDIVKHPSKNS